MIEEKSEIIPTMKIDANPEKDLEIPYKNIEAVITGAKRISTIYGEKLLLGLQSGKSKFSIFGNVKTKNAIIDEFGTNTDLWIGKKVKLSKEIDERYNKEMIVAIPTKQ